MRRPWRRRPFRAKWQASAQSCVHWVLTRPRRAAGFYRGHARIASGVFPSPWVWPSRSHGRAWLAQLYDLWVMLPFAGLVTTGTRVTMAFMGNRACTAAQSLRNGSDRLTSGMGSLYHLTLRGVKMLVGHSGFRLGCCLGSFILPAGLTVPASLHHQCTCN